MIRRVLHPILLSLLLWQISCGPGPEPASLEGEDQAAKAVISYLRATEMGDFEAARSYLSERPDYILSDPSRCREMLFPISSTGMTVRSVGREYYDRAWHIRVELKINYDDRMKLLRFIVVPGTPPKVRGVAAQRPEAVEPPQL